MSWLRMTLVLLALSLSFIGIANARVITLDDVKTMVGVSDVTISPDGSRIAFITSKADYVADKNDRTLMLYEVKTRVQRALTYQRNGIGQPAWSPDGTRLAFVAQRGDGEDAQEQIYVMDMRGGDPVPITNAKEGIQQFAWRPDGKAFAYVTADEPNKRSNPHLDAFLVGDQSYNDRSAPTPSHIWLVNADGSGDRRLTSGTWSLPPSAPPSSPSAPISWSPDGNEITFTKMQNPYFADSDFAVIAILNVSTGAIHQLTSHTKFEGYSLFSPDGKNVSYWYPFNGDGAAQNDIYVAPSSGGDGRDVTAKEIDTNVQRAIWMPDGKSLLVSGHKDTDCALWIEPFDGPARRIDLHGVQPVQPFWLDASVANNGAIAFAGTEAQHPTEIYYMASPTAAPIRLTDYNDATAALALGKVEPVTWQGPNGLAEDGVLTYPPGYVAGKKYPLVLVIHGGPNSASFTGFSALNQLLAAHGYLVFNPNYRGSDNLGETYWYAIVGDSGDGPGRDVMAGVNALEMRGIVDDSRIAVSGWSYGGYMTSWLIGHYHVWKAAMAGAAVTDWVDEYALADNGVGDRYQVGGTPWQNAQLAQSYRAQSPISYAWNATTPTLILADTGDQRVPVTQSYKLFHALKDRGTPVRFFAYPVAGHFPGDPVRSLDVWRRWVNWITDYLK